MILEDIEAKLQEIDKNVFYGLVDTSIATKEWNYIVFSRKTMSTSDSKKAYSDRFQVAIVRENYIPDGLCEEVVDKMCEIAGMRLASADCQYTYTQKPNTNVVVEMLIIEFVRARKADA